MTQEDYCSDEVSKLLKEKGFKEPCKGLTRIILSDNDKPQYKVTHQLAMKWLRKKGIFIDVSFQKEDGVVTWFYIVFSDIFSSRYGRKNAYSKNDFPTYEEAVEAALKYCLTELI